MTRLMATLSGVVVAALLLWAPGAAAHVDDAAASAPQPCLRAIVSVGAFHGRTIEVTIGLGGWLGAPPLKAPAWPSLTRGEDPLWKTAAAIRRRALERLADLIFRRKIN